jgi:multisubunit Na+/H+ antiporter MnhE subunit
MRPVSVIFWSLLGAVIYGFTLGSTDPIDYALGAGLAFVVGLLIRPFMSQSLVGDPDDPHPPVLSRVLWAPVFIFAVLRDIVIGTIDVTMYTIGVRNFENAGIVRVPLLDRTRTGLAVSAWAMTVAPGSAFVDVDWESNEMLVHVLEADDGDKIRALFNDFYERYQKKVFP